MLAMLRAPTSKVHAFLRIFDKSSTNSPRSAPVLTSAISAVGSCPGPSLRRHADRSYEVRRFVRQKRQTTFVGKDRSPRALRRTTRKMETAQRQRALPAEVLVP